MNSQVKKYLRDILDCITFIQDNLTEINTFEQYESNSLIRAAAERKVGIIGEAMFKANRINPDLIILDKEKIISMRHRIVHGYDTVDDFLMWEVITIHLPKLKSEIEGLII